MFGRQCAHCSEWTPTVIGIGPPAPGPLAAGNTTTNVWAADCGFGVDDGSFVAGSLVHKKLAIDLFEGLR